MTRQEIIKKLEEKTNSKVLVYFLGDRKNLPGLTINDESLMELYNHVTKIGKVENLSLYLYTVGGVTIAGFTIINLLKQFCNTLTVIIPYKALSTGTLMALGTNGIIMSKIAQLSPIDPSTAHAFGPKNPQQPTMPVPVNVEDVMGFLKLAKEDAKLEENGDMVEAFKILATQIHPITLGAVKRSKNQVKHLAATLLNANYNIDEIKKITATLMEERFSHQYIINKEEAKSIGLKIVEPDYELENLTMELYENYVNEMKLHSPFNIASELISKTESNFETPIGFIESYSKKSKFMIGLKLTKQSIPVQMMPNIPPTIQDGYNQTIYKQEWVHVNT